MIPKANRSYQVSLGKNGLLEVNIFDFGKIGFTITQRVEDIYGVIPRCEWVIDPNHVVQRQCYNITNDDCDFKNMEDVHQLKHTMNTFQPILNAGIQEIERRYALGNVILKNLPIPF